ncbi:MAG: phenylacetate--CoA ligase family protein [Planctomycetota bacterium]
MKELEKNQWLPEKQLKELQWKKLKKLLKHAYENVPFYKERFKAMGLCPEDIKNFEDFRRLPFLSKDDIRSNQKELVAQNYKKERLYPSWTGGSTGVPLKFKYNRKSYEWRVAAAARSDRWSGWNFGVKEFYVWGRIPPTNGSNFIRIKKKVHHFVLRRKMINSFRFSKKTLAVYLKAFNKFCPHTLIGYTGSLYNFAKYIVDNNLECHKPMAIIATAEQLYPYQRELLETAFKAKVFNRYGCREVMLIAMECEAHNGLHMNMDNLYIEILKDGEPVKCGVLGDIVITDLNNFGMPFIRYTIGDLAKLSENKCRCGRGLPLISQLLGRTCESIITPDGRIITGLYFTGLMKDYTNIEQIQVVQKSIDKLTIKIVGDKLNVDGSLAEMRDKIKEFMGSQTYIDFQLVDRIYPEKSGKYCIVKSEIPANFQNA